jgi:glutamyl-tRNA reductase
MAAPAVPPPAAPKPAAPKPAAAASPMVEAAPKPAASVAETAPADAQAQEALVTRPINPFMSQDPQQKARRLARALVSDMIVYQPDKRQRALAAGRLKEEFEDEIKKSWEEYVEQVGRDLAEANPYFTEALNEILAGGQQIF